MGAAVEQMKDRTMEYFVEERSVVRRIWGDGDIILLIFAGAAAEFALNKAVDWLYFTGRLPADPLGRLFSTVAYSRAIVFSEKTAAERAIDTIGAIHSGVEAKRGTRIPDWAYRDVLFMLIHYSIVSFELLERKLSDAEKEEVFTVFHRVGGRMGIAGLPGNYTEWLRMREEHLVQDMRFSAHTSDLFLQYRKHLGWLRYRLLLELQSMLVPGRVRGLLHLRRFSWLSPLVLPYKMLRLVKLDLLLKELLLPAKYKKEIGALDVQPA